MAIIKISSESLQGFKSFKENYNQFNTLVVGLIERGYHLNKSVGDLTEKEKTMYKELAEKSNFKPEKTASDLGSAFYLALQPIYRVMMQ